MKNADPYRALAAAVMVDSLAVLRSKPPAKPSERKRWQADVAREVAFLSDPNKSETWCAVAGVSWEAMVSHLRYRGDLPAEPVAA